VDLSIQGYFTIQKNGGDLPGDRHQQDYVFELIKPQADWNNLKPHERAVLSAIFVPTSANVERSDVTDAEGCGDLRAGLRVRWGTGHDGE